MKASPAERRDGVDALTGLTDRGTFVAALVDRCARASQPDFVLLRVDLVRFARINTALGPQIADSVLRKVGQRLRAALPDALDLARVSGDGFAILLRNGEPLSHIFARVADLVGRPIMVGGKLVELEAYIGAAELRPDAGIGDGYELLQASEIALACAARVPDRQMVFVPGMKADVSREYLIERDLRAILATEQRALLTGAASSQFSLAFQPKMDLGTGRLAGFEALLRWSMLDGTPIPPAEFIPVAERCGLMHLIGVWVIRAACAALAQMPEDVTIAVNIAPAQLNRPSFVLGNIRDALSEHGIARGRLEAELTESELDVEDAGILRELADIGLALWIDDFGTGHSSLARLTDLPFTGLKIDKHLTRSLTQAGDTPADRLLEAILSVAAALGLATVIEGIEDSAQLARARAAGCGYGQGYFYAEPLSREQALALAMSGHATDGECHV